jgi:hypothetical protein
VDRRTAGRAPNAAITDVDRLTAVDGVADPSHYALLRDKHCSFPFATGTPEPVTWTESSVRGERPTGADPARKSRRRVPTASPGEDLPAMAPRPHPRRPLPMDRTYLVTPAGTVLIPPN